MQNPDVFTATTTTTAVAVDDLSAPIERRRRFEAVVNFTQTAGVGDCMLALNRRGFVYTNSVEPIDEGETVVSGTVSGVIEHAAGEADDEDDLV